MSSDLELETSTGIITQALSQKSTSKSKNPKKKPSSSSSKPRSTAVDVPAEHAGRNEGTDPDWAYSPPPGASLIDHNVDAGLFEWDTIKEDDEVEIWLIRVPDTIKTKHLEGLEIDLPSSDSGSSHARIGQLTRKTTTYDIWSLSPSHASDNANGNDNDTPDPSTLPPIAAEELFGLSCLLPRKKKKGKLCLAPKPVTRHIVIAAPPSLPTPPDQLSVYQDPPRPSYSNEWLTHTFEPYGARAKQGQAPTQDKEDEEDEDEEEERMNVDEGKIPATKPIMEAAAGASSHEKHRDAHGKSKEGKSKKRKGEGDEPKKSKKHKMSA